MVSAQANKLGKKLRRLTGKAVADYAMIEDVQVSDIRTTSSRIAESCAGTDPSTRI